MTIRQWWKIYYRALRVARRESRKAFEDLLLYGQGAVMVPEKGDPYHVPIEQIMKIDVEMIQ